MAAGLIVVCLSLTTLVEWVTAIVPWTWCSFERCHRDLRRAGIDQAAMLGGLTTGLSLNVAMVSRLK